MLRLVITGRNYRIMRWTDSEGPNCKEVTRFLAFPLTIKGETRWLERATWVEKRNPYGGKGRTYYIWEPECWGTIKELKENSMDKAWWCSD